MQSLALAKGTGVSGPMPMWSPLIVHQLAGEEYNRRLPEGSTE
jgi:hypothetical protein